MKILKNDKVQIMTGKDKGKVGEVLKVNPADMTVLVDGLNQFKRHIKGRFQGQKSEIITISKPLPMSVVALVCNKCKKPTRVGYEIRNGKKVRMCRKCDSEV